ncbi:MAG: phosphonate ABC transporter ATP-binding protein [Lachnospiraceae bacterium]|nr:phosphonate ABC transporter ATP-binding protein [Robinsoniella sp.]MDY3765472.1 phosphonate ABC transporter ATP-binding protein [Lachnospiraceae bacterium]
MAVILKNVSKTFEGDVHALHHVSLEIPDGKFVSVIGRSGAGKSTLLRSIQGMQQVDEGEIWVDGKDMASLKGKKKRVLQQKIGMIFQDFCLVEQSSALQNVLNARLYEMPLWAVAVGHFSKTQKQEAEELLEKVGLSAKKDQPAALLSGGEKQRVAIARALMQRGTVLLADEPVASLDPANAAEVLGLLKQLQREAKITILMNSHNVKQAMEFSDWLIGLSEGRVVFEGTGEELTAEKLEEIYHGQKPERAGENT